MIVENLGYYNKEQVLKMLADKEVFGIYKTNKNTEILVKEKVSVEVNLYYPKVDRMPYKSVEGRKIARGKIVFNSKHNTVIDFSNWNNQNQIMAYKEVCYMS